MPQVMIEKDADALTMKVTVDYDAPVERVWLLWANPRLLERWWGPPMYPATVEDHDFTPGGRVTYFMTGPTGDRHRGWWRILASETPRRLEIEDGFADESGATNSAMPTTLMRVNLSDRAGGGTRMEIESTFPSREAMEQLVAMGMEQGLKEAIGQTDALLVEVAVR